MFECLQEKTKVAKENSKKKPEDDGKNEGKSRD